MMKKIKNIVIRKDAFEKMTPSQKLTILLHEQGHIQFQKFNELFPRESKESIFERSNEYFRNFPHDEKLVREFLKCKQEQGYFSRVDIENEPLCDLISFPDHHCGFRIDAVTVGKGQHGNSLSLYRYDVDENEIAVAYNTIQSLSGGIYTDILVKDTNGYKIVNSLCHARS